ncbi:MAG: hypothetical protein LC754_02625 [Acidobacteria bacterium]|nr:hypothetical protein [Acidobacteriota bacterium]
MATKEGKKRMSQSEVVNHFAEGQNHTEIPPEQRHERYGGAKEVAEAFSRLSHFSSGFAKTTPPAGLLGISVLI